MSVMRPHDSCQQLDREAKEIDVFQDAGPAFHDAALRSCNEINSPLLRLPAEIRLQIYEYVIGSRVVHVRMNWSGVCIPSGFSYSCLEETSSLLESHEKRMRKLAVPFGPDVTVLSRVCHQTYKETVALPFKLYVWAFETAFTLDQFVSVKRLVKLEHKSAIRTVAVPTPGPYRSSERILLDLQTVLLIGSFKSDRTGLEDAPRLAKGPSRAILTLKRERSNNTWVRSSKDAKFARGTFD
ncbi:hypothetical protein BKA66DRAFT_573913 [Pyrenochaeta sp. MPI-SDFR-AT-0127]|nr:hypothetical protein BKA66DRAFT_573913 [Pyrenochaeta sp. MPI-SDFR-AT-0127]